jgi:outer membrane lipoprotein LolB
LADVQRRTSLPFALVIALVVAACASVPPAGRSPTPQAGDTAFAIEGRLSARHGNDAVTANFTWHHAGAQDDLVISTPLGSQIAELHGDSRIPRVEVQTADNRHDEAPDWSTLTERALGFRLPVEGLAAWIRGAAHEGAPAVIENDAQGRVEVLRQQAWEIVYTYPDDVAQRASRLRLSYPELEVRIVIDRWQ